MISGLGSGCGFICLGFSSGSLVLLCERCSPCEGMGRREVGAQAVNIASMFRSK